MLLFCILTAAIFPIKGVVQQAHQLRIVTESVWVTRLGNALIYQSSAPIAPSVAARTEGIDATSMAEIIAQSTEPLRIQYLRLEGVLSIIQREEAYWFPNWD